MTKQYVDTRPGREGVPIGHVPSTVPDSTNAGEPAGPTPTDVVNAISKAAAAKEARDTKAILAAGQRQERETNRRRA
jgi:hypothetical protein